MYFSYRHESYIILPMQLLTRKWIGIFPTMLDYSFKIKHNIIISNGNVCGWSVFYFSFVNSSVLGDLVQHWQCFLCTAVFPLSTKLSIFGAQTLNFVSVCVYLHIYLCEDQLVLDLGSEDISGKWGHSQSSLWAVRGSRLGFDQVRIRFRLGLGLKEGSPQPEVVARGALTQVNLI